MVRFQSSPAIFEVRAGDMRQAGFELWATGANPDHYDVQLVPGRAEGLDPEATDEEIRAAAAQLVWVAGGLRPNPDYAGEQPDPEDDGR